MTPFAPRKRELAARCTVWYHTVQSIFKINPNDSEVLPVSRNFSGSTTVLLIAAIGLAAGCATTKSDFNAETLAASRAPAMSVAIQQPDIIVAVSPVRQTMQIGGSIPTLLGAGISAIQDGRYAVRIRETLNGYDGNAFFESRLRERMNQTAGRDIIRVQPFSTAAGYHNAREARQARLDGLRRGGADLVLDFDLSYGIYGPEGLLATRIEGEATDLQTGKILWRNTISTYSMDVYADMRWRDPMQRMSPTLLSPRFTSAEDAVNQWTDDGGARLKQHFEQSVERVIAAVLTDWGLKETAEGRYVLGMQALLEKEYEAAEAYLARARELAPQLPEAGNALAVAKARNKNPEEAVQIAEAVALEHPDYLPAQYNLAWFYAVELNNPEKGRPYFDKAVSLGASPGRKLEKAMR